MKAFVHGNPETSAIWGPLVEALAERGVDDVVLLSPPGFGAPTPDGWDAHHESYRSWLIGELEALGGAVDLLGHDWGAGHTYNVLAERPDLLRSWAADCAGLLHPDYAWHDAAQQWQTPEVGEQFVEAWIGMPPADKAALFASLGLPPAVAESVASALDAEMGRCILALYRSAAQPVMQQLGNRLAERKSAGELPRGLALLPSEDPYVGTPAMGQFVATHLGAEIAPLAGLGHWWMLEDPATAADRLVAFWA